MAPHLMVIDRALIDIALGKINRLMILMPPRHGKSTLGSKGFPAWYAGQFPDREIMLTSAKRDLALKWSADARDVFDEYGQQIFGVGVNPKDRGAENWKTTCGGEIQALGVGSSAFGRGAHLAIIDDYHGSMNEAMSLTERNNVHRWFHGTIRNRLNDEHKSAIVIIATPYHKDDLMGRLLKEQDQGGDQWRVIKFPAIATDNDILGRKPGEALWPQKWSINHLERERRALIAAGYPWQWEALYQCCPVDVIDSEWPSEYFDDIMFDEWPTEMVGKVIAVDPSMGKTNKSDFSAIVMVMKGRDGNYYIEADLGRRPSSRIVDDALNWHREFKPATLGCETNSFQELLGAEFEAKSKAGNYNVWFSGIHNSQDKRVRIRTLTPLLAQKKIRFKRNSPGVSIVLEQMRMFPSGKYDDGPDALEMGIRLVNWLEGGGVQINETGNYERLTA